MNQVKTMTVGSDAISYLILEINCKPRITPQNLVLSLFPILKKRAHEHASENTSG